MCSEPLLIAGPPVGGGFVYRGTKWPALQGSQAFGDITSGRILYAKMADLITATDGDPTTLAPYTEIKTDLPQLVLDRARVSVPQPSVASAPGGGSPTAETASNRPSSRDG